MDAKLYFGLLNGLSKRLFFGDASITNAYLKAELFADLPEDGLQSLSIFGKLTVGSLHCSVLSSRKNSR
jgi:hypothetical protein